MISAHSAQGECTEIPALDGGPHETWVFDVDGCLIDSLTGTSLRPGARELLTALRQRGGGPGRGQGRILLWSAGGGDYARMRAAQFGLEDLVDGCFGKDGRDDEGRYRTAHLALGTARAVFVDDRPEDLAEDLEVLAVSPYLVDDRFDRGLDVVRAAASTSAEPGRRTRTKDHARRGDGARGKDTRGDHA